MAWNLSVMAVQASPEDLENIVPDVMYCAEQDLWFEDAASSRMGKDLGVGRYKDWVLVLDVAGRIIFRPEWPQALSRRFLVHTFLISENPVLRTYQQGDCLFEAQGIPALAAWLSEDNINPRDAWGETMAQQAMEHLVLEGQNWGDTLLPLKFDRYALD